MIVEQPAERQVLRVGFVPGVTLRKWRTIWDERYRDVTLEVREVPQAEQRRVLDDGEVDLCFVRLPLDTDDLQLIPLYQEVPVAWSSKDHPIAVVEELSLADLAGEVLLTEVTSDAVQRAAFADAVLLVPLSVARTHSRRDMVHRPVTDADPTRVGLAWRVDNDHPWIEDFIGVVRGRTPNSSRGTALTSRDRESGSGERASAPRKARPTRAARGGGGANRRRGRRR